VSFSNKAPTKLTIKKQILHTNAGRYCTRQRRIFFVFFCLQSQAKVLDHALKYGNANKRYFKVQVGRYTILQGKALHLIVFKHQLRADKLYPQERDVWSSFRVTRDGRLAAYFSLKNPTSAALASLLRSPELSLTWHLQCPEITPQKDRVFCLVWQANNLATCSAQSS